MQDSKQNKESQEGYKEGRGPRGRRRKSRQARFRLCPGSGLGMRSRHWHGYLTSRPWHKLFSLLGAPFPRLKLLLNLQSTTQVMSPPGSLP